MKDGKKRGVGTQSMTLESGKVQSVGVLSGSWPEPQASPHLPASAFPRFISNGQIRLTYGSSQSAKAIVGTTRKLGWSALLPVISITGVKVEESNLINKGLFKHRVLNMLKKTNNLRPHPTIPIQFPILPVREYNLLVETAYWRNRGTKAPLLN